MKSCADIDMNGDQDDSLLNTTDNDPIDTSLISKMSNVSLDGKGTATDGKMFIEHSKEIYSLT